VIWDAITSVDWTPVRYVIAFLVMYSLTRKGIPDIMSVLKKDALWQITADLPAEEVEIHDANGNVAGTIRMRGLTGTELTTYQDSLTIRLSSGAIKPNSRYAMAKLIVMSAINEDGSPYFDKGDTQKLDSAPARILMPLFESAQRLCGLTDDTFKEMTEGFDEARSEDDDSVSL
jgi:hypothetical protein